MYKRRRLICGIAQKKKARSHKKAAEVRREKADAALLENQDDNSREARRARARNALWRGREFWPVQAPRFVPRVLCKL